jgi:zinc/manganese transport system permease protein
VAVQIVGTLLVFVLLVTPGACALGVTARPTLGLMLSVGFALVFTWFGLAVAYFSELPVGFFITTVGFLCYLAIRGGRARRSGRSTLAGSPA